MQCPFHAPTRAFPEENGGGGPVALCPSCDWDLLATCMLSGPERPQRVFAAVAVNGSQSSANRMLSREQKHLLLKCRLFLSSIPVSGRKPPL